jgi:hypothetical protein
MKKTSLTIVEQAKIAISRFGKVASKQEKQVELSGQSKSTLNNYIQRITLSRQKCFISTISH